MRKLLILSLFAIFITGCGAGYWGQVWRGTKAKTHLPRVSTSVPWSIWPKQKDRLYIRIPVQIPEAELFRVFISSENHDLGFWRGTGEIRGEIAPWVPYDRYVNIYVVRFEPCAQTRSFEPTMFCWYRVAFDPNIWSVWEAPKTLRPPKRGLGTWSPISALPEGIRQKIAKR